MPGWATHTLNRLRRNHLAQLFILFTRVLLGAGFTLPSIVKIKGERFMTMSGELASIDTLAHFFETMYQSGLYWNFLGWGQLIAAFLVLTQRYAKLGAVLFLPIIANIFMITISYDFHNTWKITGLMLLAVTMLLVWDADSLKVIVNLRPEPPMEKRWMDDWSWQVMGLVLFVLLLSGFVVTEPSGGMIIGWICTGVGIGIAGGIVGLVRRKHYRRSGY